MIGRGWFIRLGRLRLIWAPTPDPRVIAVKLHEPLTYTITIDRPEDMARKMAEVGL